MTDVIKLLIKGALLLVLAFLLLWGLIVVSALAGFGALVIKLVGS